MSYSETETARRAYDQWVARQPPDAPTFGGLDGNLYFADDAGFWKALEAAFECAKCGSSRLLSELRDSNAPAPARRDYGAWIVCRECGHESAEPEGMGNTDARSE
jgi:hypothetical protein